MMARPLGGFKTEYMKVVDITGQIFYGSQKYIFVCLFVFALGIGPKHA